MSKLKWWGYLHTSGTIQVKRYFDERDIAEAEGSPFVKQLFHPFIAANRDEAEKHIKSQIDKNE